MHDADLVRRALALHAAGLSQTEVARRAGVARSTARNWIEGRIPRSSACPQRCLREGLEHHDRSGVPTGAYAYLLGLYLGDGFVGRHRRDVYSLQISLDRRYPEIVAACAEAVGEVMPGNRVGVHPHRIHGVVTVQAYSKHWPCLFPQHGPGRKHERKIVLMAWQQAIVDEHAEALLRGLIHSDGCRFENSVTRRGRRYAYPRYTFSNRSLDIQRIFTDACDRIGVPWRQMNRWNISVARREGVARLASFIGPKR